MRIHTAAAAVFGASVLALSAACSSGEEAASGPAPSGEEESASSGATQPRIVLDGQEKGFAFDEAGCEWETDDGYSQLEYEAKGGEDKAEIEVEIVLSDPPRIDDLELETGSQEWEASDDDREGVRITVDGDRYRVEGPVTDDDGGASDMTVEFTCPK